METKLKLKINNVSLSVSGSEAFVNQTKKDFEAKYAKYFGKEVISAPKQSGAASPKQPSNNETSMGFATYVTKLGLNGNSKGIDLLLTAGCWLIIEGKKESFTISELKAKAKEASFFTRNKHGGNFPKIMKRLIRDGKFIDKGSANQYTVDTDALEEIKGIIYGQRTD